MTIKLTYATATTLRPLSSTDKAALMSFGFYDRVAANERTVEEWKAERTRAGADGIVRLLIPIK